MKHPYADKPDYCFWRRAIGPVAMADVDPVVRGKFVIGKKTGLRRPEVVSPSTSPAISRKRVSITS